LAKIAGEKAPVQQESPGRSSKSRDYNDSPDLPDQYHQARILRVEQAQSKIAESGCRQCPATHSKPKKAAATVPQA